MRCYICGNKKFTVVSNRLRYGINRNVFECQSCGLIFLDDKSFSADKYYKEKYRKKYTPVLGKACKPAEIFKIYSGLQKYRVDFFKPILSSNKKALDIGCSSGHFLDALKGLVGERIGVDFDEDSAKFVRKKLKIKIFTVPIQDTNLPKEYFDIIFILQTLEHIKDPIGFLNTVKQYLKPNGYICIEVPNVRNFLLDVYSVKEFKDFYFIEPHLYYFSPKTLNILMKKAGFIGKIYPYQLYNIMNQLNWIFCRTPQPEPIIGMSEPYLFKTNRQGVQKKINEFVKMIDTKFKKIVNSYMVSDILFYIGKNKKKT